MTKRIKAWDQFVSEAEREPLEMPMPDGDPLLITFPTGGQLRRIEKAASTEDAVLALFGDDQGKRLLALFEDASGDVLSNVILEVGREFGVDVLTGNRLPSSNS